MWEATARQEMMDLSEQQFMNCAKGYNWQGFGANGCDGGWAAAYFSYLINEQDGILQREECAQYHAVVTGVDSPCFKQPNCNYTRAIVKDWIRSDVEDNDEYMKYMGM